MKTVQHETSAARKVYNTKKVILKKSAKGKKCNTKSVQHKKVKLEKSAIQKKCNTEKVQHQMSAIQKKVQHEVSST